MKREITAIIYTLFFTTESLLMPFFWHWYKSLLPKDAETIGLVIILSFLCLVQLMIVFYLWARVFDKDKD